METYGGAFDEPGLVINKLVTTGVVEGTNGDVLGAANPEQISAAKAIV